MKKRLPCPSCGGHIEMYANPLPTADCVIYEPSKGVVIIRRNNPPLGYALPGGFVDEGEWLESAARREALEETSLAVALVGLLGLYSRPDRDPRQHTVTAVYVARAVRPEELKAGDDAGGAEWLDPKTPPEPMCFDHGVLLRDFTDWLEGRRPLGALSTEWLETEEGRKNQALLKSLG